jgi:trans-aconitate 2-methyltransferase
MPKWNPDQYLKFAGERTQPCRDLVARIALHPVRTIIDIGCGPGNSTAVLAERWPRATLTGLDNSADMISAARETLPAHRWIAADAAAWAASGEQNEGQVDLVFSNAALQWLPGHAAIFPLLLARVAPGGVFAFQMPGNWDAPAHQAMRNLAASPSFARYFPGGHVREWHVHDLEYYYDLLAPLSARVDFWATEYIHVMPDAEAIVEWYKGSGLRPFLEAIDGESERRRFLTEYLAVLAPLYPPRPDGRILFPFRRIFGVAYRPVL